MGTDTASSAPARSPEDAWRPRLRDGVHYEELDGELVLYDVARHRTLRLNPVAGVIFFFCDGEHGARDILHELEGLYARVGTARLEADLAAALDLFRQEAIVC